MPNEPTETPGDQAGIVVDRRPLGDPTLTDGGLDPEGPDDRLELIADTLSHDIVNHLNVAEGYLEMAREEPDVSHLDRIEGALGRMEELIADVVSLARSGELVAETEAVELRSVAEAAWATVPTGEATMTIEDSTRFQADRSALQHLLENLFHNAVVHAGPAVAVTVGVTEEGFYVADDGPGIPDDQRSQVFESGHRSGSEGTGLGLTIVEHIAVAHGWSIAVVDSDANGACFLIEGVSAP